MSAAIVVRPSSSFWRSRWLSWLLTGIGACIALMGLVVLVGWYAHWDEIIRGGIGLPAMKYNTALCFVLYGVALALISGPRRRPAMALAAVVAAIGLLTVLEYLSGRSIGLDELLVQDYLTPASAFSGRMSPLAASCFAFIGIGLILSGVSKVRSWQLLIAGLSACLVAVIAVVALGGYLLGMEAAYGWAAYTRMAVHTAAGLGLLSLSLLAWLWEVSRREQINLARWLPLAAAVTLMALVGLLAVVSVRELRNTYGERKTTYETLIGAQALLGDLADTQRGTRAYVLTGNPQALGPYLSGVQSIPAKLGQLKALIGDNAPQQALEKTLADDFARVLGYSQRLIDARDARGMQAAIDLESSGEGRVVVDQVSVDLQTLTDEVHRQVLERDSKAEQNYRHTVALLVLASAVVGLLLASAHVTVSREVERRLRIEAKLQELSAYQAAILDSASYAITSTGLDGVVTSFNATAERWLGYDAAEVVGKVTPALWHDAGEVATRMAEMSQSLGMPAKQDLSVFGAYLSRGNRYESEWTFRRRDGGRFPVWLSMAALNDAAGKTIGYLAIFADITERKQREAALRLSEERFRRAFDDAPIGMVLVNAQNGRWTKVNRALSDMLGYSESELIDKNYRSVTHPEDMEKGLQLIAQVLNGKIASCHVEKRYLHRSGAVVYVNLSVSLVRGEDGTPLYFVSQVENITQRREVDRLKRDFIATVSHELRTPLTSIRGSLGLIAAGALGPMPDAIAPMVVIALQNCKRLVVIINDILDIEKIQAGKMQLQLGRVAVAELLRQALALNQAYADKFNVNLVLEAAPPELEVLADPDRLMQVLTNLLSNAAKFSTIGSSVQVRALSDGKRVRFEVEDHGAGIPEEFRARIFEKFAQAESSTGRRFGGTGLGLAISKLLVEQMGGRIYFESAIGTGTIFFVELPAVSAGSPEIPIAQSMDTSRIRVPTVEIALPRSDGSRSRPRVLHVEDDADLSTVLQAALGARAAVIPARTLQEAHRLLREQLFSAVVLDPGLPDGTGLALLEQIDGITPRPPVVILSVTEMPRAILNRVAAAFVKSTVSEFDVAETILSLIDGSAVLPSTPYLAV